MVRVFRQIIAFLVVCLIAFSSSAIELSGNLGFSKASSQMASDGARFGDWPRFHFDERNTGCSDFVTNLESLTQPNLIWTYDLPNPIYGSPVVAGLDMDGGKEILLDNFNRATGGWGGGTLYCLNESGQLSWTFQTDPYYPWVQSTPAIADIDQDGLDEILYSSGAPIDSRPGDMLYALGNNGSLLWSRFFRGDIPGPSGWWPDCSIPQVANVTADQLLEIVVQRNDDFIYLMNGLGGTVWRYYFGWMEPQYDDGWYQQIAPAVSDINGDGLGEIVVSVFWLGDTMAGTVFCLDSTGNLLWRRPDIVPDTAYTYGPNIGNSPVIEDLDGDGTPEMIVASSNTTMMGVWCLNVTGGTEWFYPMTSRVHTTAAVSDIDNDGSKEIVFGADDGYIYCLNNDGSLRWRYLTGNSVFSSAAIADIEIPPGGQPKRLEIVVGSLDGKLYCLNSNGALRWTYNVGTPIYSSPAIVDLQYSGQGNPEIVFAANNRVYALRLNTAHDISISSIIVPKNTIGQGYNLPISVTVHDEGEFSENTNLTVYAGATKIYSETLTNLQQHQDLVVTFYWNTTGFSLGDYNLGATADPVPEEYHTSDNVLVSGTVTIQAAVHDVAITSILSSQAVIHEGASVTVDITVQNHGNMMESFNVTLYANETEVAKEELKDLDFGTQETLSLSWNTTSFPKENYVISGTASIVPGEIDVGDNSYVDGAIKLIGEKCVFVNPRVRVISPNATFTVDICAGNVIGLAGWQAFIEFDPEVLTRVTGGSLIGNNTVFYYGLVLPLFTGNKTLFQITFRANAMGDSPLHFRSDTIISDSEGPWSYLTFDGQVKVRIAGDINGDWSVNILDSIILSNAFLATPGSSNWNPNADINGDNVVNILDAIIQGNHFLEHYP